MDMMDVSLTALTVFSAVMLVYEWMSLYNNVDYGVMFFAGLLAGTLSALIIKGRS
ncbi:hypothetical protein [Archaeoglobus profundus]|uniref:Uncharacterized protein n=1 Tax=Archaeoglobus profundus (strain DSM 5631 / JCM 9629 / NBRC 100127 / Av18) TaxID=572546 RepID=D2RE86_ARCPA|nr:hypothetical protein [Archaeoglobus profundus]ADB58430.1 hypothetical protein Arcpr_1381 [Archaeoglobus profundus DSM 5631]